MAPIGNADGADYIFDRKRSGLNQTLRFAKLEIARVLGRAHSHFTPEQTMEIRIREPHMSGQF